MKTIEEKVKEMMATGRFDVFCWQGELPEQIFRHSGKYIEYALAEKAVGQAVREVRNELTRWHDPEELPQEGMLVLCKVDGCEYTRYLVMHRHCGDWWSYRACMDDEDEDGWYRFNKRVVSWRLIHE